MTISPISAALAILGLAGCGFALWKGGPAERGGGGVMLANLVILWVADLVDPAASSGVLGLVVDGATAAGFLIIALRFGSLWIGGAMLAYAAQFALHSFYFVTERPMDNLHAVVNNCIFSIVMWCLVIGAVLEMRRRARALA